MNNGGPAFPRDSYTDRECGLVVTQNGMSLRDYFATAALAVSVSNMWESHKMEDVAMRCYRYADAMLAAREGVEE